MPPRIRRRPTGADSREAMLADIHAGLSQMPDEVLAVVRTMTRAVLSDGKPGAVRPRHEPEVPPLVPPGMETKG